MPRFQFPDSVDRLTPEILTAVIGERHPGVAVRGFEVLKWSGYGEEMVSTAARAVLALDYAPGAPADLPRQVILKLPREAGDMLAPMYSNEVRVYLHLRPEFDFEVPRLMGGVYDAKTARFGLLLEDLTLRSAHFPNVTEETTVAQVEALLDTLAKLHARYWQSPRFSGELSWVESHLAGGVCTLMNTIVPPVIEQELQAQKFKRELVQRLRSSAPRLLAGVRALQRHQAMLPQTLLHGDTHLGNTYRMPDGSGGLLDWQLSVQGYCMHDVGYLIATALGIEQRRDHEQALIRRYIERLATLGVTRPPAFDQAWREYRRTMVWGVYIGWLTTPVTNYGWEINVLNLLRLTTAYEDLETGKLVDAMLA